ncbi:TetR/AcrR family transcriptional regulator [Streptomyces canus]|uniref:TetR/AcrR family transcriptional regulator n=1 Tax=Streptomyces TaxID=1883 RepID=UPI002E822AFF|nr:TetR/AcrR family transcriptional regulator [Streptomyces sp. NBC_00576]WUB72078.1 TetR/AcrR family transcriptional regulator [Streptomyces sp. NBC_00576]
MGSNGRVRGSGDGRERILVAALEVFSARGFRAGSLNDIAEAAGLTRAGLLHYYPSKQAVLLALLEHRDAELQVAEPELGMTLLEVLENMDAFTAQAVGNRAMVQLAHILTAEASGEEHPAREWVARRYATLRGALADAVRRSVDAGELRADVDPEAFAALVLAVGEGAENQWLVSPDTVDPVTVIRQLRLLCEAARP